MIPLVIFGGLLGLLYYATKGKLVTSIPFDDGSENETDSPSPVVTSPLVTGNTALDLAISTIAEFEGLSLTVYPDPKGQTVKWSIGYGHQVQPGDPYYPYTALRNISKDEAIALLRIDVVSYYTFVTQHVKVELTDNQLAALTSFCYNEGRTAFQNSTLLALVNEGSFNDAAKQFPRWIYETINGQKIINADLVDRRSQEQQLFESA